MCDSEDYFYAFIDDLLDQVAPAEARGGAGARDLIRCLLGWFGGGGVGGVGREREQKHSMSCPPSQR